MPIPSRLFVYRLLQFQVAHYRRRTKVKQLLNHLHDIPVCQPVLRRPEGVHKQAHGLRHAYRIRHLHQHLARHTGCHHVLRYPSRCIRCRPIHLRRVLSRESTAAVSASAAVGIYDYLASRQARIPVRTAYHEHPRRVHQQFIIALQQRRIPCVARCHARQQHPPHILAYLLLAHLGVMLRRYHYRVYPQRLSLLIVLDGYLALRVGAKVGHLLAFLAYTRERID